MDSDGSYVDAAYLPPTNEKARPQHRFKTVLRLTVRRRELISYFYEPSKNRL